MRQLGQSVCKWDLQKLLIWTFFLLSAINMCLYISIRPDRIRNNSQSKSDNLIDLMEANAVDIRESTVNSNGTREDVRSEYDKQKSNIVNLTVQINVNMGEVSKVVTDILQQLQTNFVLRNAATNNEKYGHDITITKHNIYNNETHRKVSTGPKHLLTLFSTWKDAEETKHIRKNTIRNWASFKPAVNVILFTDDVYGAKDCINLGWKVLKISQKAENGLPVLKTMYIKAMEFSDSYFYGYANSDILFTDGLLNTLLTMTYNMRDMFISKPILMTGNRWNVANITENEIVPRKHIENIIQQRGSFFMTSAEEYFITSCNYPWAEIPDLVIGIVGYDNWLVLNARMSGHFTIDTSKTVLALHQDVDKSYYRSHFRNESAHNENLLKSIYQGDIPYEKRFANCIEMYTEFINDTTVIRKREVEGYCNV